MASGGPIPEDLKRRLQAHPEAAAEILLQHATGIRPAPIPPTPAVDVDQPQTLAELAAIVRRDRPKRGTVIRLLDYMASHKSADFNDLYEPVHRRRMVEDDTVKKNIYRTRQWIELYHVPFELVVSDRTLSRKKI
jgi:hypothetical protein